MSATMLAQSTHGRPSKRRRLSQSSSGSSEHSESSGSGLNSGSEPDSGSGSSLLGNHKELDESDDEAPAVKFSFDIGTTRITKRSAVPSAQKQAAPGVTFASLGVRLALVASLEAMSIRKPTAVQAGCLPPLISGRDCIGNAKTGSGKTMAFALPILQKLSEDPYGIFALVLTPTRELAFQISEQFVVLGGPLNLKTAVVVGGMDMMEQALELGRRPHIVVATPGRLVDHMNSSGEEWSLSRLKFLVLDEADRLLTDTFASDLATILAKTPKERQTCLFTATWTPAVENLANATPQPGKQKPFVHRMTESCAYSLLSTCAPTNQLASVETVGTLKQHYLLVPSHVREPYLFYALCNPPESIANMRVAPPEPQKPSRKGKGKGANKALKPPKTDETAIQQPPPTIIFVSRPRTAAYITKLLQTLGIRATALHSRLKQRERLNSLNLFRSRVVPVLVSTDVGARGLDIADVALVVNWDFPGAPEEYTHRVGRTARAGRSGMAISFVTERDETKIHQVEERIGTTLTELNLPEEKVLEGLNVVSTAKRVANMELHDSEFGKREEIHVKKAAKRAKET